jgi:hypothetical protein
MCGVSSPRAVALGLLLGGTSTGCAVSFSTTAAPSLDTHGYPGAEGRVEARAAGGTEDLRAYLALAAGGGYLASYQSGYGTIMPELGFESGTGIRWGAGMLYSPRFIGGAEPVTRHGLGGAAELTVGVASLGAEHSALFLGPRLQVENVWGVGDESSRGLFTLGACLRWVAFDTTSDRFGMD